jgi:hypothetical protein
MDFRRVSGRTFGASDGRRDPPTRSHAGESAYGYGLFV